MNLHLLSTKIVLTRTGSIWSYSDVFREGDLLLERPHYKHLVDTVSIQSSISSSCAMSMFKVLLCMEWCEAHCRELEIFLHAHPSRSPTHRVWRGRGF